jgi:hypothetical protein
MQQRLESLDTDKIIDKVYQDNETQLADLNIEQLKEGISKSGNPFTPYRNEEYAAFKNQMNPLPGFGNPDYILTGDFSRRIDATMDSGGIKITSSDSKLDQLIERDPDNPPTGLSPDNTKKAVDEILKPQFKEEIEEATGLKFK